MAYCGVKDTDVLNTVLDRTLEPRVSPPVPTTTMWTTSDFTNAIDQAQRDLLRETALVLTHVGYRGDTTTGLGTTAGQQNVLLPQDTIDVMRVAWIGFDGSGNVNYVDELTREDAWSLDIFTPDWETNRDPVPTSYDESLPGAPSVNLARPSVNIGNLDVLYAAVTTALSNTGVALTVPDDFSPAVVWRALAILLSKEGEGYDPVRAAYCQQRYEQFVVLGKSLLAAPFALAGSEL